MPGKRRLYPEFGNRLRELMAREDMNGRELAAEADISTSYPPKMLKGEVPSVDVIRRVARALHADFNELAALGHKDVADDRAPLLEGWDNLTDADKAYVRRTVRYLSDLRTGNEAPPEDDPGAQP